MSTQAARIEGIKLKKGFHWRKLLSGGTTGSETQAEFMPESENAPIFPAFVPSFDLRNPLALITTEHRQNRWRPRWGGRLPRFSKVDVLATVLLWLGATFGWEAYRALPGFRLPIGPAAAQEPAARSANGRSARAEQRLGPTVTAPTPDNDGFFAYRNDRFEARMPVRLNQLPPSQETPDLTRARGGRGGLRLELNRVFDYHAGDRELPDVARGFAVDICRAAGAELTATEERETLVGGQRAVRTVIHARQSGEVGQRQLTIEGLTIDDGVVAWSLWAGYEAGNIQSAAAVSHCFDSATLRALSAPRVAAVAAMARE